MVKSTETVTAYLGLGSSLGERERQLQAALERLEAFGPELRVLAVSPVYESPHLGLQPGDTEKYPAHLNCVAKVETTLSPVALLSRIRTVENAGGRQRTEKWGPRTIDIDILLYGDHVFQSEALTIPHPGLANRAFVVVPLSDLAPDLRLPDGRELKNIRNATEIVEQSLRQCQNLEKK